MDKYRGVSVGNIVDCEGGSIVVPNYLSAAAYDRDGKLVKKFKGEDRHMANFIYVVRSRKTANLFGPIGEGDVSSSLCHLRQPFAPAWCGRIRRTNTRKNQGRRGARRSVRSHGGASRQKQRRLAKTPATLGVPLALDSGGKQFTGEDSVRANELLKSTYRAPYVVPEIATM